jgi:FkbM family methyltransferase
MKTYSTSDITSLWQQQLLSQAAWYNLRGREARKKVTDRLAEHFLTMQQPLGTLCFLEVGAHEASFSCRAKSMYPEAKVFAFEANPYVYDKHKDEINRDAPSLNYIHSAICDHDGTTFLAISNSISGKSEALDSKRHSLLTRKDSDHVDYIEVPCAKLDSIFDKNKINGIPSCLWCDVEGASSQVLIGAEAILGSVTSLYIELSTKEFWEGEWKDIHVFDWLIEHDFVPIFRDFEWSFQYNAIFVNKKFYHNCNNHNAMYIQRCVRERIEEVIAVCQQQKI